MAFKTNNKVLDLRAASEVADVAVVVLDMWEAATAAFTAAVTEDM